MKAKGTTPDPTPAPLQIRAAVVNRMIEEIAKKVTIAIASQLETIHRGPSPNRSPSRPGIIRDDESYTLEAFMERLELGWSAYCTMVREGLPVRTGSSRFGTINGKEYNDWVTTRPMKKRRRQQAKPAQVSPEIPAPPLPPQQD